MEVKIYSVFDKKSSRYDMPYYFHNDGTMIRGISSMFNKKGTIHGDYPADFSIHEVGTFNDMSGQITANTQPRFVIEGVDLVDKEE